MEPEHPVPLLKSEIKMGYTPSVVLTLALKVVLWLCMLLGSSLHLSVPCLCVVQREILECFVLLLIIIIIKHT